MGAWLFGGDLLVGVVSFWLGSMLFCGVLSCCCCGVC